jgi:HEAT repeats
MRLPLALFLLLVFPLAARAEPDARVAYLARQLKGGKDPRVRAQAALVLGQSGEPAALAPLCEGLQDGSEVVRSAAARALEQLGELEALSCLGMARADPSAEVKRAVARALAELRSVRDRKPSFYIALAPVRVPASFEPDLGRLTEQRLRRHLQALGTRWAPEGESKASAHTVLKQQGLRGILLQPQLVDGGGGAMRLRLLCMSYPEQSLLGEVEVKAAGGKPADLVKALAPRAVAEAAEIFVESRN